MLYASGCAPVMKNLLLRIWPNPVCSMRTQRRQRRIRSAAGRTERAAGQRQVGGRRRMEDELALLVQRLEPHGWLYSFIFPVSDCQEGVLGRSSFRDKCRILGPPFATADRSPSASHGSLSTAREIALMQKREFLHHAATVQPRTSPPKFCKLLQNIT